MLKVEKKMGNFDKSVAGPPNKFGSLDVMQASLASGKENRLYKVRDNVL